MRFAEPRYSLQRERVVTFCIVQKVTKKHARTCKKLPVASFCASETAETGRIANGREQGDHVSRRRLRPATSIQIAGRYMIVVKVTGFHQVTGNAEICNFSSIAGNDLNRCDAPALQHKIRAESKRTAVFFANSRLRVARMGGGGWKRVALDGNKERFVRIKDFLHIKRRFLRTVRKLSTKEKLLACENGIFLRTAKKGTCKRSFCA